MATPSGVEEIDLVLYQQVHPKHQQHGHNESKTNDFKDTFIELRSIGHQNHLLEQLGEILNQQTMQDDNHL